MKMKDNLKTKENDVISIVFKIFIFTVLLLYALTIVYLLFWGLLTSLKANVDFAVYNNKFGLPNLEYSREEALSFKNYALVLEKFQFDKSISYYWNDVLIEHTTRNTIPSMLFNTIFYAAIIYLPFLFVNKNKQIGVFLYE